MRLDTLARRLAEHPELREVFAGLRGSTTWASIAPEARPCFLATAFLREPRQILLVANGYDRALAWQAKLGIYGVPKDKIRILPSGLSAIFEDAAPETVALSDRLGSLRVLASGDPCIVIATPQAALERTLPAMDLLEHFIRIEQDETLDVMEASDKLVRLGYEPAEPVRVPGQFSRRGGILDVFPMGAERPIRIEFFGDTVESLRVFDPMSQRSIRAVSELELTLSRETLLPSPEVDVRDMLERTIALEASRLETEAGNRLEESITLDVVALEQRVYFDRLDLYRPLIQPDGPSALDYLGEDGLLVLEEPLELEANVNRLEEELADSLAHRHQRGEILQSTPYDFVWTPQHFADAPHLLSFTSMNATPDWLSSDQVFELGANNLEMYRGQPQLLTQSLANWLKEDLCVAFASDQPMRTKTVLSQVEIFPTPTDQGHPLEESEEPLPAGLFVLEGNPAGGFICPALKLAVVTDQELFGVGRLKLPQRKFSEGVPIATVLDLKPGDFVVHINFGIGIYKGLVNRTTDGIEKEYLHIEYKAPDRLFVPADQLDRIQKYVTPGDESPKINRLTGTEWKKAVTKAREEAREFARDLIQLYAKRKRVERPAFGPDTDYQQEMEGTFPWAETPSQLQAIEDVKMDLRMSYPMDRLVCGDVGFGKTEVAVRAAFKVADAGKQVAVLCPTTILSEQHFRNFEERLSPFDIEVVLLNRFVTGKERKNNLDRLADGRAKVVIGTHALLSDELKFNDLGLLVIDEEQKFGVKHKEALKELRVNVDVLSMSATPIPRTLSMALMSIREMSLINDPPPGRLPIRTFVRPMSMEVIREACLRELARGGQVYFVSNRIQGIYHTAEKLRKALPQAKIAVGHGQMGERELEPVMVGFIKGEIDILVSTTIVESGLDIPNANTMIVENADKFGLAQLYQLRGRVGRSDRQAYSYLLYTPDKTLTEHATERLKALAEFNQLGSGYSLAFRDLQIRGAGDLLGAKQSGQMTSVGYELYSQLIESEVQFLKTFADGKRPTGYDDPLVGLEPLPTFDLPVKALIPESYIEDQGQRLYFYKQLMTARDLGALREVAADLEDRYGLMPDEVRNAVDVMGVRMQARDVHIVSVDGKGGRLAVTFQENFTLHPRIPSLLVREKRDAYFAQDKLIWPFVGSPVDAARDMVKALVFTHELLEEQRASLGMGG